MEREKCNVMDLFHDKKFVKICAPMVRYSKLQFRTLVRKYDCDLCFTPMLLADSFCLSEKARLNEFSTNLGDKPVIVQFAANTAYDFVGAAHMVSPYADGVDLNCGCPQRWAKTQGIGCVMLENPETIYDLIRQCRNHISKPFTVSVKMRILSDIKKSVEICRQLEHCGVSFLTVHGRVASQQSVGPVNLEALKILTDSVKCPLVANGGIRTLEDIVELHEKTNCQGVMVASGLLTNPTLFSGTNLTSLECVQNWVDICYNSTIVQKSLYSCNNITSSIKTVHKFENRNENLTFQCFHHHLVFMIEKILAKHLRKIFNNLQTFDAVLQFLYEHFNIKPNVFSKDEFKINDKISLSYLRRDDKYLELKCELQSLDFNELYESQYNPDLTDGNYFHLKTNGCDDDVDNMDTCISSLFIND